MSFSNYIGQTLDGKYRIESEIGRGGMGTVFLATHLGTERPVALKIIAPQFMQRAEFVERFRREARAAGRLRHPHVVDVTDFGITDSINGKIAYLVMEYLDGCTLGEILEEEKNLPVAWTIDILEQVCSAVHEAHNQGIIHRDLKPDNIWLEPNPSGGYTVKVLDFGIAKLEENFNHHSAEKLPVELPSLEKNIAGGRATVADISYNETVSDNNSPTKLSESATIAQTFEKNTLIGEGGTLIQPVTESATIIQPVSEAGTLIQTIDDSKAEDKTAIFTENHKTIAESEKDAGTKIITEPLFTERSAEIKATDDLLLKPRQTAELTRVGAVLGTPLFMSPEQCKGEKLSPRSDIYSLGVIAYRMLGGKTPFDGDFTSVMEAHREVEPPPLTAKKIPSRVKKVIYSALAKNPDERPATAEAFASKLRSQSEGLTTLIRRSLVIYSEHLPKFLGLTTFLSIPLILLTIALIVLSFLRVSDVISEQNGKILVGAVTILLGIASAFCMYFILGTTTWIVTQYLAVPLRPIRLRPALKESVKKWKTFAGTGLLSTILTFVVGFLTCGIGFLVTSVFWSLLAPVVMMENLRGWKALKRSQELVWRRFLTAVGTVFLMFLMPAIFSGMISFVVNVTARAFDNTRKDKSEVVKVVENQAGSQENTVNPSEDTAKEPDFKIEIGNGQKFTLNNTSKDMRTRVVNTILESLIQIFWLPAHIFVTSFSAIIIALLYLKTRQSGGESMKDLLEQFEETDKPRKKWQERVRNRLIQSGRITSGVSKS
ncbi:MAG: serine/threonine protein kinase [Pyrinomonadaceae bacterium]|nr:serine/threonine protein kinase [Pyrinomonadaceae bacterium]